MEFNCLRNSSFTGGAIGLGFCRTGFDPGLTSIFMLTRSVFPHSPSRVTRTEKLSTKIFTTRLCRSRRCFNTGCLSSFKVCLTNCSFSFHAQFHCHFHFHFHVYFYFLLLRLLILLLLLLLLRLLILLLLLILLRVLILTLRLLITLANCLKHWP